MAANLSDVAVSWAKAGRRVVPCHNHNPLCLASFGTLDEEDTRKLFDKFPDADGLAVVTGFDSGIFGVLFDDRQLAIFQELIASDVTEITVCYSVGKNTLVLFMPPEEGRHFRNDSFLSLYGEGECCPVYDGRVTIFRRGAVSEMAPFPQCLIKSEVEKKRLIPSLASEAFFSEASERLRKAQEDVDFADIVIETFYYAGKNFGQSSFDRLKAIVEELRGENLEVFAQIGQQSFDSGANSRVFEGVLQHGALPEIQK